MTPPGGFGVLARSSEPVGPRLQSVGDRRPARQTWQGCRRAAGRDAGFRRALRPVVSRLIEAVASARERWLSQRGGRLPRCASALEQSRHTHGWFRSMIEIMNQTSRKSPPVMSASRKAPSGLNLRLTCQV